MFARREQTSCELLKAAREMVMVRTRKRRASPTANLARYGGWLAPRATGSRYRLYMPAGLLGVELVP
jgi:hypothetical protein